MYQPSLANSPQTRALYETHNPAQTSIQQRFISPLLVMLPSFIFACTLILIALRKEIFTTHTLSLWENTAVQSYYYQLALGILLWTFNAWMAKRYCALQKMALLNVCVWTTGSLLFIAGIIAILS